MSEASPVCKVDINRRADIGAAIMFHQRFAKESQPIKLSFSDGGTYAGGLTLTRHDDALAVRVEGCIFNGSGDDRGTSLDFMAEPDGPIGMPIRVFDCDGRLLSTYTDDDDNEYGDTSRAEFYASGVSFTAANAPKVKAIVPGTAGDTSSKAGSKLFNAAKAVEAVWSAKDTRAIWASVQARKSKGEFGSRGKASDTLALAEFNRLKSLGEPVTEGWPRKMPLPERPLKVVLEQNAARAEQIGVKVSVKAEKKVARIIAEAPPVEASKRTDVIKRAKRAA